ncbi:Cut8 six-helix bundle-domain-containing protein [Geopyxis carbonaria]|nr:Cut8 six-helix bundle-domain-containing protein [Geopyxis carbonaria]
MSALINPQPFSVTQSPLFSRCSPSRLGGKKRKADDDDDHRLNTEEQESMDHQMSGPSVRVAKKIRSNVQGRPLPLSRLLETVDIATLKNMLHTVCEKHPELAKEISDLAPQPTVQSALAMLENYERNYQSAVPYGGNPTGDYAYNRVKTALMELLEALSDYTTNFLPPNEPQTAISLSFLDGATDLIHRLPTWDNPLHNYSKQAAYEEMSKAWILVIQEATKRGAGISLQYGGWETKLLKHNEHSGGRMDVALSQMKQAVSWVGDSGINGRSSRQAVGFGFGMHSGVSVPVRSW